MPRSLHFLSVTIVSDRSLTVIRHFARNFEGDKQSMDEKLEIPNCPICGDKHIYKLKVERTYVMKWLMTNDLSESSQPVRVTRIFVCPVKNQKFQASFILYQISSDKIKSVIVEGVIEDETE